MNVVAASPQAWFGAVDELLGNTSRGAAKWRRVTHDASIVGRARLCCAHLNKHGRTRCA